MDEMTDTDLIELALAGDKDAFGALAERHRAMAVRIARGVVPQDDTATDLAQEAILQAYLSLRRLRDLARFQSWLYGIVLNVCRGYLRDRKASPLSLESLQGGIRFEALPFGDIEPGPDEVAERRELHQMVLSAVDRLSPRLRAATLMFYYDQLSIREIAAVQGASVSAVKVRLHRARLRLRDRLSQMLPELPSEYTWEQGGKAMVQVTIADVVAREQIDEETGSSWANYVVMLLDEAGRRFLPIWIGPSEGQMLAMGMRDVEVPRPMTYDLIAGLLEAAGARVDQVRVEALRDDTFFAVATLGTGDASREVDCRPSDAFNMAARAGCPIYVSEQVMEQAAAPIPEDTETAHPWGRGADAILREMEDQAGSMMKARRGRELSEEETAELRERLEVSRREMLAYVFGEEE